MHGNLKNILIYLVIHISRNHNDEIVIIDTGFLNYFKYTTQLFCKLFITQLTRMCIWIFTNFIEKYRHIICKTNLSYYLQFIHYGVCSLCRISDTGIIMVSQRRCDARDSQNNANILYNARFLTTCFVYSLANFGFVLHQNEFIHVIIGFKHDVPYSVGSEALAGYSDMSGATRLVHWLILVVPSCLRSHNAWYIMRKSFLLLYND